MYVGLPWIHERGQALARRRRSTAWPAIAGVELLTPRDRMATLVTFRIARLAGRRRGPRAGRADLRDRPDDPAARRDPDQRRLLQHRRRDRAVRRRRSSCSPPTRPRRCRQRRSLTILGQGVRDGPRPRGDPASPTEPARRRSPVEIRWRQFRNAPRPVVRAVLSEPDRRDRPRRRLSRLRRRDQPRRGAARRRPAVLFVARPRSSRSSSSTGSVVTYLVVPLPRGSGERGRRSAWSAALGLFAAVPIATSCSSSSSRS